MVGLAPVSMKQNEFNYLQVPSLHLQVWQNQKWSLANCGRRIPFQTLMQHDGDDGEFHVERPMKQDANQLILAHLLCL